MRELQPRHPLRWLQRFAESWTRRLAGALVHTLAAGRTAAEREAVQRTEISGAAVVDSIAMWERFRTGGLKARVLGLARRLQLLLELLNTRVSLFQRGVLDQRRLGQYVKGVRSGADAFSNKCLGF
jgi:hypothetical protein